MNKTQKVLLLFDLSQNPKKIFLQLSYCFVLFYFLDISNSWESQNSHFYLNHITIFILDIIGVNSLRLGGFQFTQQNQTHNYKKNNYEI